MFIVLESEYSVEDFLWDQDRRCSASSLADSEGRFQIADLLPRGTLDEPLLYSILVRAEGYMPRQRRWHHRHRPHRKPDRD